VFLCPSPCQPGGISFAQRFIRLVYLRRDKIRQFCGEGSVWMKSDFQASKQLDYLLFVSFFDTMVFSEELTHGTRRWDEPAACEQLRFRWPTND
jgi:hypothetical protein